MKIRIVIDNAHYESVEDLIEIDWIKSYKEWDEFNNFCVSESGRLLMIENEDGTWLWVVGRSSEKISGLPVVRMIEEYDE